MITVALASHRPETLILAKEKMLRADVIILEEPPNPQFTTVLEGRMSIKDYLIQTEFEYLEYGKRLVEFLRGIYQVGKQVLQVEPYLERLTEIHYRFASGETVEDVLKEPSLEVVYRAEKKATDALIRFYMVSVEGSFADVVKAVVDFARVDAERISLRDRLRADEIGTMALSFPENVKVYVEAGYIHLALCTNLIRMLGSVVKVRPFYVMERVVRSLAGTKMVLSPGDKLTLGFIFRRNFSDEASRLLAARSLIYVKLLEKNEMLPESETDFPHTFDEIEALKIVNKLDMEDCHVLFEKFRTANRFAAESGSKVCREIVRRYLNIKRRK